MPPKGKAKKAAQKMTKENLTRRILNKYESEEEELQLQRCKTRQSLEIMEPLPQPEEVVEEVEAEEEISSLSEYTSSEKPNSVEPSSEHPFSEHPAGEDPQIRGDVIKYKNPGV